MTAIVCIDDRGGILFLGRRNGRDREVYRDIARSFSRILLTEYSRELFSDIDIETVVTQSPLASASGDDVCFIESSEITGAADKISRLIIYKWNRKYPSDTRLGFLPTEVGFSLVATEEFVGKAHDKITKEIYER